MPRHTLDGLLLAAILASTTACSTDSTEPSPDAGFTQAGSDAGGSDPDAGDSGDAGTGEAVWLDDSEGFTIASSGGLPLRPVPGGCREAGNLRASFEASGRLSAQGCDWRSRPLDITVQLSAADRSRVLTAVAALRTTEKKGCGADAPNITLNVRTRAQSERTYRSNFYAGCDSNATLTDPLIDYSPLSSFADLVYDLGVAARDADDQDAGSP